MYTLLIFKLLNVETNKLKKPRDWELENREEQENLERKENERNREKNLKKPCVLRGIRTVNNVEIVSLDLRGLGMFGARIS